MQRIQEGIIAIFQAQDMVTHYGLGVTKGLWELEPEEAMVIARLLARHADAGSKKAQEAIAFTLDAVDYVQAGMIVMPRAFQTIRELVRMGGPKPALFKKDEPKEEEASDAGL